MIRRRSGGRDRGSVTVEAAAGLPALLLLLLVGLTAVDAVTAKAQCVDAARGGGPGPPPPARPRGGGGRAPPRRPGRAGGGAGPPPAGPAARGGGPGPPPPARPRGGGGRAPPPAASRERRRGNGPPRRAERSRCPSGATRSWRRCGRRYAPSARACHA
ncbi:TadE/TadG family type IV pilus assembly protein [Polymorphospora lycopeni]|uniref:TadE/TadG family type IV pilus assembly protein n=1 Tax=Polymorphospora lycopeni TaxID=3140240 RepID=UPI004063094C